MSRKVLAFASVFVFGFACKSGGGGGGGLDTVVTPSTYVATAGEGDLVVWTVADGGGDVTAVVTAVDQLGNPLDGGEFTIRGACSSRNATFDYRTCTISSVSPTPPGGKPAAGDQFYTLELPGVAFLAHPAGADGGAKRHDLHVGVIRGSCGDLSGTYNMVHVGPPGFVGEAFGQFTLASNTSGVVSAVTHWDYGFVVNGQYSTNNANDPIKVALTTGDTGTLTLVDGGQSCANGVATITMAGNGANGQIRTSLTQQGALLIDLQRGNGGIIGVKASSAATLDDVKNKTLYIVLYQGDDELEIVKVEVDGDAGIKLVASTDSDDNFDGGESAGRMVALSDTSLATYFGASAVVDTSNYDAGSFVDGGWVQVYGGLTTAHAAAPAPATFPGFFALVNSQGRPWDSDGRMVVMMVQKADAGLFVVGGHLAVNNPNSGMQNGNYTRCFDLPVDAGYSNEGRRNDRQRYCVDGPFVGYSR